MNAVQQIRVSGGEMNLHRELNPHLFGSPEGSAEPKSLGSDPRIPAASVIGTPEPARSRVPYPPIDVKAMELAIANLKGAILQMEKRTETIGFKMEELARTIHARLERFSQSIVRVEESQSKTAQETNAKFATVAQKVNERKISDMKVQELVDRHNSIVRNFENRMLSMQRLVSEQEMSLHNAQAALEEARNEISRLKR